MFPAIQNLDVRFDFRPWRLSGVVYGALLNDPSVVAALGQAALAAPYKAVPRAPVLCLKPRNTLALSGTSVPVSQENEEFEVGASLAVVIGRTACRVSADDALSYVGGWALVADLSVRHDSLYRPAVRFKARDRSCILSPRVVPRSAIPEPGALRLETRVNGVPKHVSPTAGMRRPVPQLLQDVTEFMTLRPGDILMLGTSAGAPRVRAGDSFSVECPELGWLEGRLVEELAGVAA